MKPDNIMVDRNTGKVTLIDFGFASHYLKDNGEHIGADEQNSDFFGNLLYASYDQMNFFKTSRKDDIIATFYMFVELLNNSMPIGDKKDTCKLFTNQDDDIAQQFHNHRNYKEKYTLSAIVKYITKHQLLNPFEDTFE